MVSKKNGIILCTAMALSSIGASTFAADLQNLSDQSCGLLSGTWHFVNNQTGKNAANGTLVAVIGGAVCSVGPSKTNQSVQHFFCVGYSGALTGASTGDLPGRLVLSDFSCDTKCEKDCK